MHLENWYVLEWYLRECKKDTWTPTSRQTIHQYGVGDHQYGVGDIGGVKDMIVPK